MGVDFEFPVREIKESKCTSEVHGQKSQAKKRLEMDIGICRCPIFEEGEMNG